ncbi:DUF3822 family protein [Flavobacterium sp. GT3R68]|uniref:DUF3822 family protein n=1 Tax=Flavobacterium sp. GT3R68 TaxID=2594437 RepID=UPI000F896437|nr:DUF3822 family protein [Flavobacterium sp. GT3R68]RTY94913.1 DUF3822 family protein [Flavobacterium sp. GSN2]TRW91717.1 DUF3822 family protein [Flavobacterium sp. GT3R68]
MTINTSITEKKYKKLAIQVTLNGFSYCVFDTLHHSVLMFREIDFGSFPKAAKVEDYFWKAFIDDRELTKTYDEVIVLHDNNLSTFVPKALFEEQFLGSYLQYNTKVFETDFFAFDEIPNYEMNNVYIPYVNINNYLLDQFDTFDYKHANGILVSKLLDLSKNVDDKQVFVHFSADKFEIVAVQNQKLLLFNSFDYKTKEDFIYYLLFASEQLNLNPEHFKLQLLGDINEESELFQIAFKYVRNISLLDVSELQKHNDFSTAQNLKHFILFQS